MIEQKPIKPSSEFEALISFVESLGVDDETKKSLKARIDRTVLRARRISSAKGAIKAILLIETMTGKLTFDKRREFFKQEKAKYRDEIVKFSYPKKQNLSYEKQDYEIST